MRHPLFALVLIFLAGVSAFFLMRNHKIEEHKSALVVDQLPELAWLKKELQLSEEEFSKIRTLHLNYRPKCLEMCKRISEARENLQAASQNQREWNPALEGALQEHTKVQADCQRAVLQHLYQTAAILSPDQAERFLKATLPTALGGYHGDATGNCHAP